MKIEMEAEEGVFAGLRLFVLREGEGENQKSAR
jgi:hypothetical protein